MSAVCCRRQNRLGVLVVVSALALTACGGAAKNVTPGGLEPDKLLFERGTAALTERRWATAREYFRQIVDGYPQSPFRADSKLGVGDTYLGEGGAANAVLAINEYREFLTFYPTNARADYAQYKLAMSHFAQMAKPERDQSETREAVKEFEVFFQKYPNSTLMADARKDYREARDRLSESDYRVGLFYYRSRWFPGALDRFRAVLKNDPEYSGRDAIYYYLGEILTRADKPAEALVYYERLISEFQQSEFLDEARRKAQALKDKAPPLE